MSQSIAVRLGHTGLKGWRSKFADAVAEPASQHVPFEADQIRALLGAAFLGLSVLYVVKASGDVVRVLRRR